LNRNTKILFLTIIAIISLCFGCEFNSQTKSDSTAAANPTFSQHIAPIVFKNCSPCHRKGGAGPFELATYNDVASRAKMIAYVTRTKYMPPWPADRTYSHFREEKYLTEEEIELITRWNDSGSPIGDSTKIPELPAFPEGSNWGEPDLVIKMPDTFEVAGSNTDQFLMMKFPFEIDEPTFVRAIEFIPGNRKAVHHLNGHMINYDEQKTNFDLKEWYVYTDSCTYEACFKRMNILNDDGSYPTLTPLVSNYLPGVISTVYPKGIGGFQMAEKGVLFINDIHYGPQQKTTYDRSYFNVFFDDEPPKRPTKELQLGTLGISEIEPPLVIPPDTIMTFTTRAKVFQDISVLTVNPHMHLLGRKFLAYAITESNDTIPLIRINDWDFKWQYFYTYKKPVKLPKGSIIEVKGVYDNTTDNPFNPFNPPQIITERDHSMKTTDEMFQFIITFLPYQAGDENIDLTNVKL